MDSQETPETKITTPVPIPQETSERQKDPKRVAQGKRLAAISKEAKERKLREKIEAEKLAQQYFDREKLQKNIFLVAAPVTVFLGLYLLWQNRKTKTVERLEPVTTTPAPVSPPPKPGSTNNKNYSLFD